MIRKAAIAMLFLNLAGCGDPAGDNYVQPVVPAHVLLGNACTAAMTDIDKSRGQPEEINTYDTADGYHNRNWWYWSKGIEYTFIWAPYVTGCQTSTYTFTPIAKAISTAPSP